ncbi:MAG: AtpZ/AtpI family protein [Alphaproteobacteria bacterium]|nr:AtpZ/AtpI family protein [Alphaproteobacteria bacterium]
MSQTPDELGQKIKEALGRQDPSSTAPKQAAEGKNAPSGTAQALRAGTDLVAALVVGGFLGYWIDRWLGTKPWGMIILFFLGFAAGFLNIYRSQTGQDYKIGFKETPKDKKE